MGWLRGQGCQCKDLGFIAADPGDRGDPHGRPIAVGIFIIRPARERPTVEP